MLFSVGKITKVPKETKPNIRMSTRLVTNSLNQKVSAGSFFTFVVNKKQKEASTSESGTLYLQYLLEHHAITTNLDDARPFLLDNRPPVRCARFASLALEHGGRSWVYECV